MSQVSQMNTTDEYNSSINISTGHKDKIKTDFGFNTEMKTPHFTGTRTPMECASWKKFMLFSEDFADKHKTIDVP